jgi:penicillin-binding protein 2
MSVIHAPPRPKLDSRLLLFPGAMLFLLTVLFLRLWYFQVIRAPELTERADATRSDEVTRSAPRGFIYDRNGTLLAGLKPEIVVSVTYTSLAKHTDELQKLAVDLQITQKSLNSKLDNARRTPGMPTPILIGVKPELAEAIVDARHELPGVDVDLVPTRYYPDGTDYPHVLGIVRLPSAKDLERLKKLDIEPSQFVGKSGIERYYEADLMGTPGKEVMDIDAKRHPIRVVKRDNPVPGDNLILSLDARLQHLATQEMAEHKYVGSVVALDPNTGEVLCMVSSPTYDQNEFQGGISQDEYDKLREDPNTPLLSRSIDSSYPPGSTFKIVTSLAAYRKGIFDPNHAVFCDGGFHLGKAKFACLGHHGDITFHDALVKSCNTYFADLGYRTGEAELHQTCLDVGLGESTGIDIQGEKFGLVPSDAYVVQHYKHRHWYGGDTVNFSIGQGWLRASPLQMCDVAAMVANDGVIYKPHLVRKIIDGGTGADAKAIDPEVLHQVKASDFFWKTLKDALVGVIQSGTARRAQIPGITWAGKTGSSEHGHHREKNGKEPKTHSWFVGFAPVDHPKIAIAVLVEDAGHGGEVSAPIARDVVSLYLKSQSAKAARKSASSRSISDTPLGLPSAR